MKIEHAYRRVLALKSAEGGVLDLDNVKEVYPDAVEGDQINYQKLVPLLVEAVKEHAGEWAEYKRKILPNLQRQITADAVRLTELEQYVDSDNMGRIEKKLESCLALLRRT